MLERVLKSICLIRGEVMSNELKLVRVRLFGACRSFYQSPIIKLDIPRECTVQQLRGYLIKALESNGNLDRVKTVINTCAFATEESVLMDDAFVGDTSDLAVLPPVCGG